MKFSNLVFYTIGDYERRLISREGEAFLIERPNGDSRERLLIEKRVPKGIASRFAGLKSDTEIETFAKEYGSLGLADKQPENLYTSPPNYRPVGMLAYEKLSWWRHHITIISRLLRIYYILKRAKSNGEYDFEEALGKVITFEQHYENSYELKADDNGVFHHCNERKEKTSFFEFAWKEDNEKIGLLIEDEVSFYDMKDFLDIASYVLVKIISRNLQGGIGLEFGKITFAKDSEIGIRVSEQKCTYSLLAAIYYDLWEMITEDRPVTTCGFRGCGRPIEKTGRREYCNDACKQAAYRERKQPG